jgi:uncharacterized membrane protein
MDAARDEPLVTWTHVIYGLHALSLIAFVFGVVTVVGPLVTGCPSIIAVIVTYVKRGDVRGTWLESHFCWQIRTFWYGLLWTLLWTPVGVGTPATSVIFGSCIILGDACAVFLFFALGTAIVIGWFPLGILPCPESQQGGISAAHMSYILTCAAVRVVSLWLIYRIARGWMTLNNDRPMYAVI